MEIHKYHGGGLAHPDDPNIPQARVEVYLRSAEGETFYVGSLAEGISHLLSKDGYRLSISSWPDGAGWGPHQRRFGVVIRREGDEFSVQIEAPGVVAFPSTPNRVVLKEEPPTRRVVKVTHSTADVEGLPPLGVTSLEPGEEVPWPWQPPWGETDLPVYSQEEIDKGVGVLIRRDWKSNLADVLKGLRKIRQTRHP